MATNARDDVLPECAIALGADGVATCVSDATADEIEEMTAIVRKGLRHALTC